MAYTFYVHYLMIFCLLFAAVGWSDETTNTPPNKKIEYLIKPQYNACIRVYNGGTGPMGQRTIRLYNACSQDLFITACVKNPRGELKLFKSGIPVQRFSNFYINTDSDQDIGSIQWSADPFNPAVPPMCSDKPKQ